MNLRQLATLCEVVNHGLSISAAAHATNRSQPSVTRQIQELESELGFDLLVRRGGKIMALTSKGEEILTFARRMLQELENIRRVGKESADTTRGDFTLATTHTQARYTLPPVIRRFAKLYPRVRLRLRQGSPSQCHEMVLMRQADLAICTEVMDSSPDLVDLPCYRLNRSVITPPRHPLLKVKPLTLDALNRYPLITYDDGFSARWVVNKTFANHGLSPNVVLSAIDADVSKSYVELGMGIAILATVAFNPKRDAGLRRIDAKHLFEPSTLRLVVRKQTYLRGYMLEFLRLFAPSLSDNEVESFLRGEPPVEPVRDLPAL